MSLLERLYAPPEIGAPGKRKARAQRRDLMLAGVFVLVMAAVALGALALLIPGLFGDAYRLDAYFAEATGLDAGIQVMQEGFVIGIVERVEPVFPGRDEAAGRCPSPAAAGTRRSAVLPCFRATLRIRDNWPVPEDSVAQISSIGLLQEYALKIQPGGASRLLLNRQAVVTSGPEIELTQQLSDLTITLQLLAQEKIEPTLEGIQESFARFDVVMEILQRLGTDLEQTVDQVSAIFDGRSEEVKRAVEEVERTAEEVQRAVKSYGDLANDIRGLVRDNKPSVERSLDDTQYLLQELAAALTPILTNIEDATRDLSALARDLRNNPAATILQGHKVEDETPWFE
ncbi:MAG: MlaD family protein [Pseudomonadota bacterium]|nr:MlaD family protein [Pseudomonadota bacterium]